MKTTPSSKQSLLNASETTWCIFCVSVVLLGNVWNVVMNASTVVTLTHLSVSTVFAVLAGTAVVAWEAPRKLAD